MLLYGYKRKEESILSVQLLDEARIVEDALRTLAEPVRLRDIVELTKDKVDWKLPKGTTLQMRHFMRHVPTIEKSGYGMYKYSGNRLEKEDKNGKEEETVTNINPRRDEDKLLEVSDKDKDLLENFRKATTPVFTKPKTKPKQKYRVGDVVEGKITGIEDYGAFIENEDASMQGLIHITNIKDGSTDDVHRHFQMGDNVKAKIIAVRSGGKLSLSTKNFDLPDYLKNEELEEKLKPIKEQLGVEDNMVETLDVKQEQDTEEVKQIFMYMQGITGIVSEKAKDRVRELLKDRGMFKFSMALGKAESDFEVDTSMLLVKEIESKLSDGL
jgi:general stress protein 13